MHLNEELREKVRAAVQERFADLGAVDVTIDDRDMDEGTITVVLKVRSGIDASEFGRRYFSATRVIRDALGAERRNLFPHLVPEIGSEVAA